MNYNCFIDEMWILGRCYRLYCCFFIMREDTHCKWFMHSNCLWPHKILTLWSSLRKEGRDTISSHLVYLHGQWLVALIIVVQQHLNGDCWLSLFKEIWFSGPWKCKAQLILNKLILVHGFNYPMWLFPILVSLFSNSSPLGLCSQAYFFGYILTALLNVARI